MLEALGSPHRSYRTLQVAGTNGKGSAVACAGSVLAAHLPSEPVGTYMSPHVVRFGERIQLDGRPAPDDLLDACARRLRPEADRVEATHFEALTVLALLAFAEAGASWAVLETGMGGRLDATTVVDPEACGITSIAVDHEAHLGPDLESIAREKAGVIRRGIPVASAPQDPGPASVLEDRAREVEAPLLWVGRDASVSGVDPRPRGTRFRYRPARGGDPMALEVALAGRHQAENAGLALLMLEAAGVEWSVADARRGLARVRLPGRLETVEAGPARWILDLGHNPAALEAFLAGVRALDPPRPWVFLCSVLADKDWPTILEGVAGTADAMILTTPPSAPPGRRWDLEAAGEHAAAEAREATVQVEPDLERAAGRAVELAGAGTVLVVGSSYLVGDLVREAPGLSDDR